MAAWKWFRPRRTWGFLLLGVWLILLGVSGEPIGFQFKYLKEILNVLAIVAGILILLER